MDSLNPSAIAQTLLFLGNEKRKWKILIFTLAMFITNSVLGIAVYYGALSPLINGYNYLKDLYPDLIFCPSIATGCLTILVGITFGILKYLKQKRNKLNNEEIKENKHVKPISLISMFLMGMLFTGVELATALPYFGFLTSLVSQHIYMTYHN